jgi:hypothetical protein
MTDADGTHASFAGPYRESVLRPADATPLVAEHEHEGRFAPGQGAR